LKYRNCITTGTSAELYHTASLTRLIATYLKCPKLYMDLSLNWKTKLHTKFT